jgi:hypothetical protein
LRKLGFKPFLKAAPNPGILTFKAFYHSKHFITQSILTFNFALYRFNMQKSEAQPQIIFKRR